MSDPPRTAWLDAYGTEFPEFLEHFEPAASLAYLPDVARLERAVGRAMQQRCLARAAWAHICRRFPSDSASRREPISDHIFRKGTG